MDKLYIRKSKTKSGIMKDIEEKFRVFQGHQGMPQHYNQVFCFQGNIIKDTDDGVEVKEGHQKEGRMP